MGAVQSWWRSWDYGIYVSPIDFRPIELKTGDIVPIVRILKANMVDDLIITALAFVGLSYIIWILIKRILPKGRYVP